MEFLTEYWEVFLFSLIPLLGTLILAWWLSPLGGLLTVKNEIFAAVALPNLAHGIASLLLFLQIIPGEKETFLIVVTMFFMLVVDLLIPKINEKFHMPELVYGGLFVCGNTATLLTLSLSWQGSSQIKNTFSGEIMAFSNSELLILFSLALICWSSFYFFRGYLFHITLNERDRRFSKLPGYKLMFFLIPWFKISAITLGSIICGPLLTTSLLIVPSLFSVRKTAGIERYLLRITVIGLFSTFLGFNLAILLDYPPAPLISFSLILVGLVSNQILSFFKQ